MIKVTPDVASALGSLTRVQSLITKEIQDNLEDSTVIAEMLEARMYIEMLHEWVHCSEELESKNAGDVFQEIHDGWV